MQKHDARYVIVCIGGLEMKVDVHLGLSLLVIRELCKSHKVCMDCPMLPVCSSGASEPIDLDPATFPNVIVKVEIPVDA